MDPKDRPSFEKIVDLLKKEKPFFLYKWINKFNFLIFLDMPHLLISTKIRLEPGPTIVGDERTDPKVMEYLGAKLFHEKCNN